MTTLNDLIPAGTKTQWSGNLWSVVNALSQVATSRTTGTNFAIEPFADTTALQITATSTALGANLIPTMTSNISNGVASASTEYSSTYAAWKTMDKVTASSYWCSATNYAIGAWLRYDWVTAQQIYAYSFVFDTGVGSCWPTAWQFQISNDGRNWTTVDTRTGQSFTLGTTVNYFYLPTSYTAQKIRVLVTACGQTAVSISELGVYSAAAPAATVIGGQGTPCDNLIPSMTSNTTPSGVAFATAAPYTGQEVYRAFDKVGTTIWANASGWSGTSYIGYAWPNTHRRVTGYRITGVAAGSNMKTWTVQVSSDSVTGSEGSWTTVDTQTNFSGFTNGGTTRFTLATPASNVKAIRFACTAPETAGYGLGVVDIQVSGDDGWCSPTSWCGPSLALGTQTWEAWGSLPTAILNGASVFDDGIYVYSFGGANGVTRFGVTRTTKAALQSGTQTWTAWGDMPLGTATSTSCTSDWTYVYILGGWTGSAGYSYAYRTSIAALQSGTFSWTQCGALPTATGYGFSAMNDGTYVYVIGGYGTAYYTTVFRTALAALQAGTQTWAAWGALPVATSYSISLARDGDYVYAFGGYNGSVTTGAAFYTTLASLQAGTQAWTPCGTLPTTAAQSMAVVSDGAYAYVIGGYSGSAHYSTAYRAKWLTTNTPDSTRGGYLANNSAVGSTTVAPVTLTGTAVGEISFIGYNVAAQAVLDIGKTGSNAIEVYPVIDGTPGSALSFTYESLGNNRYRFYSETFSTAGATSLGVKIQSFARTVAPNFQISSLVYLAR